MPCTCKKIFYIRLSLSCCELRTMHVHASLSVSHQLKWRRRRVSMAFYVAMAEMIHAYMGLSPTAFFTILVLMFGAYCLISSMFISDEPEPEPQLMQPPPSQPALSPSLPLQLAMTPPALLSGRPIWESKWWPSCMYAEPRMAGQIMLVRRHCPVQMRRNKLYTREQVKFIARSQQTDIHQGPSTIVKEWQRLLQQIYNDIMTHNEKNSYIAHQWKNVWISDNNMITWLLFSTW